MKAKILLTISTFTAILPLTIGSLIFWIWFFYPNNEFKLWGILTILISTPICIGGLMMTVFFKFKNKNNQPSRRKANRIFFIILLNIPFCFCYLSFASYLMDTERITIINDSENDITNINVFGAGDFISIALIEKGKTKTAWIHMIQEGSIRMTYKENGQDKTKQLESYTGPGMCGHRLYRHLNWAKEEW